MADENAAAENGNGEQTSLKPYIKGLLMILVLAAVGYAVKGLGIADGFDQAWIDANIKGRGLWGYGVFLVVGAMMTAVGLPRQIVSFMAGYAFGVAEGTMMGVLATAGGCVLTFSYARFLGRDLVKSKWPGMVAKVDGVLGTSPFLMTLLIRLLPLGNNALTNLAAGVTHVRALSFIGGSALGYIPQTLVFALVGKGVKVETEARILVSVVLFVVSGVIGAYLYRKVRKARKAEAAAVG